MEAFVRLGEDIESAWCERNFNEFELPGIAKHALAEHDLPSKVTPWEVIAWAMEQPHLPQQQDPTSNFGEPPITVYSSSRFHIDVYFWFTGTTATHQHAFSGAFQVMEGSSIHSWLEFAEDDHVNVFMKFGTMRLKLCELLSKGEIQEIQPGAQYIHALFHLDEPSVTIVVRTKNSPLFLPQYRYERPCLAVDPFYRDDTITKKSQSMVALLRAERPDAMERIVSLIERSDIHSTYHFLAHLRPVVEQKGVKSIFNLDRGPDRLGMLIDAAKRRHGRRAERLEEVFGRNKRDTAIINRRSYVTDPDLRFFLAVLLNAETRENVYRIVSSRFPEADPQEKVLDWVYDLANIRVVGLEPPNALGIEGFGDVDIIVLEAMLNGGGEPEIAAALTAAGSADTNGITERVERIRTSPLLAALFIQDVSGRPISASAT